MAASSIGVSFTAVVPTDGSTLKEEKEAVSSSKDIIFQRLHPCRYFGKGSPIIQFSKVAPMFQVEAKEVYLSSSDRILNHAPVLVDSHAAYLIDLSLIHI